MGNAWVVVVVIVSPVSARPNGELVTALGTLLSCSWHSWE